jgi:ABC-type sulfate transport system permease component
MVVKTMNEQGFCENCNQKQNCGSIYHQLGNTKGPSVVVKVVIAFLLPIVVFIISLAIFEEIYSKTTSSLSTQTALSMLSALAITFSCILITRVINKRLG